MNIIFYRYGSVCEPDYIDAFKKLGVTVVEDKDGIEKNGNVEMKMQHLGELIADKKPLFVFSINFFPFISLLCNRLKIQYMAESVDCPVFELFDNTISGEYNRIFLFDYKQYESIKPFNPSGIFYLPLGAASDRMDAVLGGKNDYLYDVSFVGSLYKEKDPFLNAKLSAEQKEMLSGKIHEQIEYSSWGLEHIESILSDKDVEIIKASDVDFYASDRSITELDRYVAVNDYISPHMAYVERLKILNSIADSIDYKVHLFTQSDTEDMNKNIHVHGGVSTLVEMPAVFRQSRINLNITMRSIQTGIPQRVWDVLACRGFLITNDQPEISEYFRVGYHLETYRNEEELIDKIKYYLSHEDERIDIAQRGYELVSEKHTIFQRAMSMIRALTS